MTIDITYIRYPGAKPLDLTIDGTWTEDGFDNVSILHGTDDIRDLLLPEMDAEIIALADETEREYLRDKAVERAEEARAERIHA